jgi:hypothetical protein
MTVSISPYARQQFYDSAGNPIVGGKLFTYLAGTTTKANTYTTSVGNVANSNPIVLDASGRLPYGLWLTDSVDYKFVLAPSTDSDPPVSPYWTEDHIKTTAPITTSSLSEWVLYGSSPSYISQSSFSLSGDQRTEFHIGRRIKAAVTAGTVYGTILTSTYSGGITTVTLGMDSTFLDSGLTAVSYGIISFNNTSNPRYSAEQYNNRLINGRFDIWQRNTTHSTSGYGSSDRWATYANGSTFVTSQQTHTLGDTLIPNTPKYYHRTVVTSSAGAGNYCRVSQRIESVLTLSGMPVTLRFYAKADSAKNIAVELMQSFGTTGSPSADVVSIGSQLVALTTAWKQYAITVSIPSISGKTLGSDNNDYLGLRFWLDAGSTYNANTASLGQRSGTYDISMVQLKYGTADTSVEYYDQGTELRRCQRYYQQIFMTDEQYGGVGSQTRYFDYTYPVVMRSAPTITAPSFSTTLLSFGPSFGTISANRARITVINTASTGIWKYTSDSPVEHDAEL